MVDLVRVGRALLSVSDKSGLVELARRLDALGVELISTGGTARALRDAGLPTTGIEDVTGFPEMMDGRVKTLHPKVHGGLLGVRDNPEHAAAMAEHAIGPIDLVVINLYPFERTIARPGCTRDEAVEQIDIGGPSMVRSGAKNHAYVAVVTDPSQYAELLVELERYMGSTSIALRRRLAQGAFERTATYDRAIADYLTKAGSDEGARSDAPTDGDADANLDAIFPARLDLGLVRVRSMRHGENPHQQAALYRLGERASTENSASNTTPAHVARSIGRAEAQGAPSVADTQQHNGKELSYNNLADASAALDLCVAMARLERGARASACVIKHANPCGAALGMSALIAIDRALAGDPLAAFGGILACSHAIGRAEAERLVPKDVFLEVVVAPSFSDEALAVLRARSSTMRLLSVGAIASALTTDPHDELMFRSIPGGVLAQTRDLLAPDPRAWMLAAGPAPEPATLDAAAAIEVACRAMSSNAIAIGGLDPEHVGAVRLFGGGVGQVDRVTACRLAVEKAGAMARGAIAVSDAFFPFPDGPTLLIDAGVRTIVHPGGSKRDQETFDLCASRGVTCLVTGVRRFKH